MKKKANDARVRLLKLKKAVAAIREKHGTDESHKFQRCNKDECGSYLQYKKQAKDPGMPKDVVQRRKRCVEWMGRPSPPFSPHASDDELEDDVMDAAAMDIGGLEEAEMEEVMQHVDEYGEMEESFV